MLTLLPNAYQHKEFLVGFVAREVLPTAISKHRFANVQAVPAQASTWLSQRQKRTCDLCRPANQCGCGIHKRARTSGLYRRLATKQVKTRAPTAE